MKKIYSILLCIGLVAGFVACEKDKEFALTTLSINNEVITPAYNSADVRCSFKADATISDAYVQYALSSSFAKYDVAKMTEEKGIYTAQLVGLADNTMYYIRYEVSNKYSSVVTEEVKAFQTLQCTVPTIVLDTITDVMDSHAKVQIHLTFDGGASVTDMGICWSTQTNPTIEDIHKSTKDTLAVLDVTSLQPNTKYYVRAYAQNKVGVAYSEEKEFTTLALPEVRTEDVSDIQVNSALLSATLVFDGNDTATIKGFCWSEKSEPTIEGDHIAIDTASAGYTYLLTALLPETQYFVRAYAQNKIGIVYGEEVSFTTKEQSSTPNNGTENGYAYVDLGLSVKWASCNVGANKPEDYGDYFAWGETTTKDTYDWSTYKYCNGSYSTLTKYCNKSSYGSNGFTDNKTQLELSDDVAAVNWGGSWRMPTDFEWTELRENCTWTWTTQNGVYGRKVTSKTNGNSIFLPAAGRRRGSSLDDAGIYGHYWSSSVELKYDPYYAYNLGFDSSYMNRSQYYRYCGESVRPVLGESVVETTIPTVTTTIPTQITETTAVAGGNVTADGNASVTERGVCIATVSNPTTSNTKITAGSGTGSFTCNLTGLQANTTYYVRAYATNEKGTAYGEEVSFTTKEQSSTPNNGTENGYAYVDLGLSVKWATCNVGASKPEEYGDYFAWGETQPKDTYDWSTYKWCNGSSHTLTKYCTDNNYGTVDNKTVLDAADDAATANWGGSWRMPTDAELTELRENCTWTWIIENDMCGYRVTSKKENYTDKSIFLPVTSNAAFYWSSSLGSNDPDYACDLYFDAIWVGFSSFTREYGRSVRPVLGESVVETTIPTVTTTIPTQITETSAVAGGNVTADGNASVTERGVCIATVSNPTTSNTKITAGSGTGSFTCNLTGLQANTTYYVRAYAVNSKGTAYGEEVSFTTESLLSEPTGMENGYGYVDLGLSVKWATCNVGANNPEDYGDYFAWGETTTKDTYNWSTYKWCNGSSTTLTKYNTDSSRGTVDNKMQLELSDDAARANWGGSWRMPTDAEWTELREQCTSTWTIQNGVNGYRVTSKTNGNSIFLPAAGWRNGSSLNSAGSYGYYWSYSLYAYGPNYAWYVYFFSGDVGRNSNDRCLGFSVRPVLGETTIPTVTTTIPTQITETSAVAGGNVTADGNASVTERGVVYGKSPNPTISNLNNTIRPCGSGLGEFTYNMTDLQPSTTYYVRAYAINSKGTAYGDEVSFTTKEEMVDNPPSNLVAMPFSVSADKQVTFSKGNLQYTQSTDIWSFAESQLDMIGTDNVTGGSVSSGENGDSKKGTALADKVDLFGWSTSATNFGVSTSTDYNDYYGSFVDWGSNQIGNDAPNTWRTLTYKEWRYLLNTRPNASSLKGVAQVNGVNGLIVLPDNWTCPSGVTFKSGFYKSGVDYYADYQTFTAEQWSKLESAGAVFLPASSNRDGSSVSHVQWGGYYWSATEVDSNRAYFLCFYSDKAYMFDRNYNYGNSVRLVKDLQQETVKSLPSVTTTTVTQITETTAVAGGNVTSDGGASVTERGVVYSTNTNPVITNLNNTIRPCGSGTGAFTYNMTGLQSGMKYYIRAYAKNDVGTAYGEEVSFTTKEQSSTPNNGTENGYAYVDLGLSVKWATMNVGASKAEEYGDYFAWGEVEPKTEYNWSTYQYCNGSYSSLTKYNNSSSYGSVDNKTTLELADDAARMNWGGSWRMPTYAEWTELCEQCTWTCTTQNGVYGCKVTSKKSGYANNSIFLPAAGFREDSSLYDAGSRGYYWSSSLITGSPDGAWRVDFLSSDGSMYGCARYGGLSVRPVCP